MVIYFGINGYLDDIFLEKVIKFIVGLLDYLNSIKFKFGEIIK